jgi:hypothetical protein
MTNSSTRSRSAEDYGGLRIRSAGPRSATGRSVSGLQHGIRLTEGVTLVVDLVEPDRWMTLDVEGSTPETEDLLLALVGPGTAAEIGRRIRSEVPADALPEWPLLATAREWQRLALVDAVDRWLQLPLVRALVGAERAFARQAAALTLGPGRLRSAVVVDAVRLARAAALGVTEYLHGLRPEIVPQPLVDGLSRLAQGYRDLSRELSEPDEQFDAVIDAWTQLQEGRGDHALPAQSPGPVDDGDDETKAGWTSLLDPRQVPARVVQLSPDPRRAEIRLHPAVLGGEPAVDVEIDAFPEAADDPMAEAVQRLLVRLVDGTSGHVRAEGLLTLEPRSGQLPGDPKRHVFRSLLPLRDLTAENTRADVFDALIEIPPAKSDTDPALLEARRLSAWLRTTRQEAAVHRVTGRDGFRLDSGEGSAVFGRSGVADLLVAELAYAADEVPLLRGC